MPYKIQCISATSSVLNQHYIIMKKQPIQSFQDMDSSQTVQLTSLRHFGSVLPIGIRADGEPKYVLGPQYSFFIATLIISTIIFTWMGYDIASKTKGRKAQISIAISLSLAFYIYSYIKIGFSNPGIASSAKQLDQTSRKNHRYCTPCKIIRQPRTVHCYKCDICIYGYDHHCPWIGKCVGSDNLCAFRLFLLSVISAIIVFSLSVFISNTYQQSAIKIGK